MTMNVLDDKMWSSGPCSHDDRNLTPLLDQSSDCNDTTSLAKKGYS